MSYTYSKRHLRLALYLRNKLYKFTINRKYNQYGTLTHYLTQFFTIFLDTNHQEEYKGTIMYNYLQYKK